MEVLALFAVSIAAYLLGSVPVGLVLTRLSGYGDIRAIGSGNIGATNVLRTGNKKLAAMTLFLDAGKGALAASLPFYLSYFLPPESITQAPTAEALCLIAAVLGHCFPVWLHFKGGKGVATLLGAMLSASPLSALVFVGIWPLTAFAFRYSSLAALLALCAVLALQLVFLFLGTQPALCVAIILAVVVVIYRHKDNIKRLLNGTESKIGKKHE